MSARIMPSDLRDLHTPFAVLLWLGFVAKTPLANLLFVLVYIIIVHELHLPPACVVSHRTNSA